MTISPERARELLGKEARILSADAIAEICRELDAHARLVVKRFDREQRGEQPAPAAP